MKKITYFISLILLFSSSVIFGQNKSKFRFADNKHSMTIPFELSNNHIYVKVRINNSDTLDFLFDSGAGASGIVIDSTLASNINLKATGKVSVGLTGGQGDFLITDSVSLTIDKLFVQKQKIAWLQLKAQEKEEGHKIDGILSYSFFKYFVFEIDYKNKILTITDPVYFNDKALKNKIKMIDLGNNKVPIVKGVLTTKGNKAIKTEFNFDTGHDEYFVVGKKFILKNKLENDTLQVQPERNNFGFGGETIHKSAIINSFKIGSLTISNPNTIFSFDQDGIYSTLDGVLLGGLFFKNYKLTLNYPKKYLVLMNY